MSVNAHDPRNSLGEISQGPSPMEEFLERNQKAILALAILIAIGAVAFVIYHGIEKSLQQTAGEAFSKAQSVDDFKKLIQDNKGTQAAKSAEILLADQQWAEGKKEASMKTLQTFLTAHPNHPAAPTAKASLASEWMVVGETAKAVSEFNEIVDDPKATYMVPYALICLGDISKVAGDTSKAKEYYKRLTSDYAESYFANSARIRLETLNAKPPVLINPPAPAKKNKAATKGLLTPGAPKIKMTVKPSGNPAPKANVGTPAPSKSQPSPTKESSRP